MSDDVLLIEVGDASRALGAAWSRRDDAIRAAFTAGVPRVRIAEAAGLGRERIYQIADTRDLRRASP